MDRTQRWFLRLENFLYNALHIVDERERSRDYVSGFEMALFCIDARDLFNLHNLGKCQGCN